MSRFGANRPFGEDLLTIWKQGPVMARLTARFLGSTPYLARCGLYIPAVLVVPRHGDDTGGAVLVKLATFGWKCTAFFIKSFEFDQWRTELGRDDKWPRARCR